MASHKKEHAQFGKCCGCFSVLCSQDYFISCWGILCCRFCFVLHVSKEEIIYYMVL